MDLTVHIGLPRAASTFLQERIFAQWPGLHYIGKTRNNYPDWLKWWHYGSALEFSRKSDWIRDSLESIADTGGKNVLSSEMFAMWGDGASTQAERLHTIFPEAKIVMVLRHPFDRMRSFYKAIVENNGFWQPLESLIEWEELPFVFYKRPPICIKDYCYNDLVKAYEQFFPKNRILVLKYEDMIEDMESFLTNISRLSDCPLPAETLFKQSQSRENVSSSDKQVIEKCRTNAIRAAERMGVKETGTQPLFSLDSNPLEMSEETKLKVKSLLQNRCDAYFPTTKA